MCGICGIVGPGLETDAARSVAAMNAALRHRGPDSHGQFDDRGASLAMSRLAIIDVEGGDQPLYAGDRETVAVVNGEIYNFRALRDVLVRAGHRFVTASDSEVVVHGYREWGEDVVSRLHGMFAIAVYDRREQTLLLARDRFGEKPLFYYRTPNGAIAFASELRSLVAWPAIPRQMDREAIGYFLRVGFIPAPLTSFAGIAALRPGHWLRWNSGQLEERAYFIPRPDPDPRLADDDTAAEAVAGALKAAVHRQAVSDVPLGAFLSGGIDSSAVVAMLAQDNRHVRTFTVKFEDASYDESGIAREVAEHLGTEHHEIVVPNLAFQADDLWRIVDHVGMPFSDSSAIPTYHLCRQVRQHVTVALSGDGGDEAFGGYPFFRWGLWIKQLRRLPRQALSAGAVASRQLARLPGIGGVTKLRQIRRALDAATAPPLLVPVAIASMLDPPDIRALVRDPEVRNAACGSLPWLTDLAGVSESDTPLRHLMAYRLQNNLPGDMLVKVDRMSMACSLEVRAPMLDVELCELALKLPDRQLLRNGAGKHVLRNVIRPHVPASVLSHPKSGFSIPLHHFRNDTYAKLTRELLHDSSRVRELFFTPALDHALDVGLGRARDRADLSVYRASHQLWSLLQIAAWAEHFQVIT